MKTMIVAAAAVFMLTGMASAGVPFKAFAGKEATKSSATLARAKPGAGGGSPIKVPCMILGCKMR